MIHRASDNHTGGWVSGLAVRGGTGGLVTGMMRMRVSRPVKSAGLVVYSGRPSAIAVAAIIRSTALPRDLRPVAMTAAVTRPKMRAASASNGTGSNSLSARWRISGRPALGALVVRSLLVVAPYLMRPGGQLRQGDGACRHRVGIDPSPDQDVGVEDALPGLLMVHMRCRPDGPARHLDQPGMLPGQPRGRCATWRRTPAWGRTGGAVAAGSAHSDVLEAQRPLRATVVSLRSARSIPTHASRRTPF